MSETPPPEMKALRAVEHVVLAVAPRARAQARRIRARARFGQAVACKMLHGAELRQKFLARLSASESVDHPRRHVVNRNIGSRRRAALRELLEDQRGIKAAERRAADVFFHVDTAEAEGCRLAQRLDRKNLVFIPVARMRHHFVARKLPRGRLKSALFFGEVEVHDLTDKWGPNARQLCRPCPVASPDGTS